MTKMLLSLPRRDNILFILDLNGTLMHRITKAQLVDVAEEHPNYRPPNCTVNGSPIFFRPGHHDFLRRLLGLGQVAVWTSAMPKNAHPMVMHTFNGLLTANMISRYRRPHDGPWREGPHELLFLWSQEQCDVRRVPGRDKPEFKKDLQRAWEAHPRFSQKNTIIIDDSPAKVSAHTKNLIAIPEFVVTDELVDHTKDDVLLTLATYLERILSEEGLTDVTKKLKDDPPQFTRRARDENPETTVPPSPELDAIVDKLAQTELQSNN